MSARYATSWQPSRSSASWANGSVKRLRWTNLAAVLLRQGRYQHAEDCLGHALPPLQQALTAYASLGVPDAADVRARLKDLGAT